MKPTLKTIPWMAAMQATMVVTDHWRRLDSNDRSKVLKTLADSRGLPNRMTAAQREHLIEVARMIDHRGLMADLAPIRVPGLRGGRKNR
ncbi:MAG: hypothetical protein NWP31_00245 [Solirubrobacteraceae bacterium]|jgi:hypothetical protein|nr:hypothetical protein [Solirubrobacteraceae bacterium]MDP4672723.1 hypothetical protein [Solirubrobacteraceae bacterium]MDP4921236.1 hypothetical protein [Solirubrobacteraceae bacterium]MDP5033353.1 hypothetical protein [Solirubrobacteraceae bacterium]